MEQGHPIHPLQLTVCQWVISEGDRLHHEVATRRSSLLGVVLEQDFKQGIVAERLRPGMVQYGHLCQLTVVATDCIIVPHLRPSRFARCTTVL